MIFKTPQLRPCNRSVVIAAGVICAAMLSGSAAAQSNPAPQVFSWDPSRIIRQTSVGYSDLDLRTVQGAQTLLERIKDASEAVCPGTEKVADPDERRHIQECRAGAVWDAVRTVHNRLLTSLAKAPGLSPAPNRSTAGEAMPQSHTGSVS